MSPLFVNNFRLRSRVALFLVSLDSCVRQNTHTKIWAGCCVWGRLYNCFRGSDAFNLLERLSSVHEPSFFVNNFRLRGLIALILVSLDSCVHQDTQKKIWCDCCDWDRVYNCFRRDWCWRLVRALELSTWALYFWDWVYKCFRFRGSYWGLMI